MTEHRYFVQVLSPKLMRRRGWNMGNGWFHNHWCLACGYDHDFAVEQPFSNGAQWTFDGNVEAPTFGPSMNIGVGPFSDGSIKRCHYNLAAGRIQYHADCTHALVGQTVDLVDYPSTRLDEWRLRGFMNEEGAT